MRGTPVLAGAGTGQPHSPAARRGCRLYKSQPHPVLLDGFTTHHHLPTSPPLSRLHSSFPSPPPPLFLSSDLFPPPTRRMALRRVMLLVAVAAATAAVASATLLDFADDSVAVGNRCRFTDKCLDPPKTITKNHWSTYYDGCGNSYIIKPNCQMSVNVGGPGPGCKKEHACDRTIRQVRERYSCFGAQFEMMPGCNEHLVAVLRPFRQ